MPGAHVLWVQGGLSLAISGESVGPALNVALGLGRGGGREAVTLWGGAHLLFKVC